MKKIAKVRRIPQQQKQDKKKRETLTAKKKQKKRNMRSRRTINRRRRRERTARIRTQGMQKIATGIRKHKPQTKTQSRESTTGKAEPK
jgi:IS4 transposase